MITAKNALDWHCPTPLQVATAAFISGGHLARHVQRMRRIYEARRRFLTDGIRQRLPELLDLVPSAYGMHVTAFTRESTRADCLASQLAARGVRIHSLERYYFGGQARAGFVFGLGVADTDALRRGLMQVQHTLERASQSSS
jgi:GntR family transcriptional regulator / MocR family aminotransferase